MITYNHQSPEIANEVFSYNTTLMVTCPPHYKLNSPEHNLKRCTTDGTWDGPPLSELQCEPVTCPRPSLQHHGMVIKSKQGTLAKYPIGSMIVYSCHTGAIAPARCSSTGEWSGGPPVCPETNASCSDIRDHFKNGKMTLVRPQTASDSASRFTYGSRVYFKCNPGFVFADPTDASLIICDKGHRWSHAVPTCVAEQPLTVRPSGHSPVTMLVSGTTVVLFAIAFVLLFVAYRWRQRRSQRKRWQRYFGNYAHRQSRTNFTTSSSSQEMKLYKQRNNGHVPVPVTDL